MIVLVLAYGVIRKVEMENLQKNLPHVRIAIINPCAPPEDSKIATPQKISRLLHTTIPDLVKKAAEASGGKLDIVVLPESAVPFLSAYDNPINRKKKIYSPLFELMVQLIAYNWNVDVFFNETVYNSVYNKKKIMAFKPANSSALYSRDGLRREMYSKRILLAFGEYLPGEELLEDLGLKDALT
jgi:apolipoprotein N-acyltransferase